MRRLSFLCLIGVMLLVVAGRVAAEEGDPASRLAGLWRDVAWKKDPVRMLHFVSGGLVWQSLNGGKLESQFIIGELKFQPEQVLTGKLTRIDILSEHVELHLSPDTGFTCRYRFEGDELIIEHARREDGQPITVVEGTYTA